MHGVRDFVSAEAYCTLGGDIIPAKTAQSFGERFNLQPWTTLFTSGGPGGGAAALKKQKTVEDSRKRELTRTLLEVYMEGGYVGLVTILHLMSHVLIRHVERIWRPR